MGTPSVPNVQHVVLPGKEEGPIAYTLNNIYNEPTNPNIIWLRFINGLGSPQAFCKQLNPKANIFATTYDRYGQGLSRPTDGSAPRDHSIEDSISDLHNLVTQIRAQYLSGSSDANLHPIIIAHSIGLPLTRLYMQRHPGFVSATLFLDPNIPNINLVDLLPNSDAADFDPPSLPRDTSLGQLIWTRENYRRMFSSDVPNPEHLDRRTLPELLVHDNQPVLVGRHGAKLELTIVPHDPEKFGEESLKICTRDLTEGDIEPAWREYNVRLLKLDGTWDVSGDMIVVAKDAGHFVQRDKPRCVADEIWKLVRGVERRL